MDGTDVGMIQGRCGTSFPAEALERLRAPSNLFRQELQGDEATKLGVLGLVHHAHPTAAELFDDAVVRDGLADHLQECFYEKVIKVKADVAALLNLFSDVGIERAAILCLSALVALAFSTILFSFRSQNIIDPLRTKSYEKTLADATHRCRASIRTLSGPLLARCILGSDLSPGPSLP